MSLRTTFDAGVKDYRETYWEPDYTSKAINSQTGAN